jgi:hypothetical protein
MEFGASIFFPTTRSPGRSSPSRWRSAASTRCGRPSIRIWYRPAHCSSAEPILIAGDEASKAPSNSAGYPGNRTAFFGRDIPSAQFRDRYGREGATVRGLTVEQHLAHVREDLIPLAERCGRVMREALAALETIRAAPSRAVERSRPTRISVILDCAADAGAA